MEILVLGGTSWLGGAVARAGLQVGADVTCLARGCSGEPPPGVRWLRSDRVMPNAYDEVRGQAWDLVLDVSWQPGLVRGALEALTDRAGHWAYVSSCSVYADQSVPGQDESGAVLPAHQGDEAPIGSYGEAKVACEQLCRDALGERLLVARAGLIAGYGDRSDRFGYWPGRMALAGEDGGRVLVPAELDVPAQAVDVGDLSTWLVTAGCAGVVGTLNAVGPRSTLAEVLDAARTVAGFAGDSVPAPSAWLLGQGVEEYMGERSLPLWMADPASAGFSARDGAAAEALGLRHRPLADLSSDSLRWERELGLERDRRAGLSRVQERTLLAALPSGA